MILFLGAGVIVSYALVYSGISQIQLGKDKAVSTLQALWPSGAKVTPASFPKPTGPRTTRAAQPQVGRKA